MKVTKCTRSITEAILLNDAHIWKEARRTWMNVVVEGIMKEYDTKMQLARVSDFATS